MSRIAESWWEKCIIAEAWLDRPIVNSLAHICERHPGWAGRLMYPRMDQRSTYV
jgi:hypothetical protein